MISQTSQPRPATQPSPNPVTFSATASKVAPVTNVSSACLQAKEASFQNTEAHSSQIQTNGNANVIPSSNVQQRPVSTPQVAQTQTLNTPVRQTESQPVKIRETYNQNTGMQTSQRERVNNQTSSVSKSQISETDSNQSNNNRQVNQANVKVNNDNGNPDARTIVVNAATQPSNQNQGSSLSAFLGTGEPDQSKYSNANLGDPLAAVKSHKYMMLTWGSPVSNNYDGPIRLDVSNDGIHWTVAHYYSKGNACPAVHQIGNTWYITYSGNGSRPNVVGMLKTTDWLHFQEIACPLFNENNKLQISAPDLFQDKDGKWHIVYAETSQKWNDPKAAFYPVVADFDPTTDTFSQPQKVTGNFQSTNDLKSSDELDPMIRYLNGKYYMFLSQRNINNLSINGKTWTNNPNITEARIEEYVSDNFLSGWQHVNTDFESTIPTIAPNGTTIAQCDEAPELLQIGKTYYLYTDPFEMESNGKFDVNQKRDLYVSASQDLVHWSKQVALTENDGNYMRHADPIQTGNGTYTTPTAAVTVNFTLNGQTKTVQLNLPQGELVTAQAFQGKLPFNNAVVQSMDNNYVVAPEDNAPLKVVLKAQPASTTNNKPASQSPRITLAQGVLDQSQAKMVGTYPWFYNLDGQHVRFSENGIQQLKDGTFMLSGNAPDPSDPKNGRDQDLVIIHLDKNFNLIDSMRILHGGHGSSCGAIMNNNGQIMVYELLNDRSNPKGNNRVIMVPYQPHKTLKNNDPSIKVLVSLKDEVNFDGGAAISQDGKYLAYSTASDIYGTQNLQIHVCQIVNGKLVPVTTIDKSKVEPGSQSILQAFTFRNDGELMFTFGGAANDPQDAAKMKVDPREIVGVDIETGKVLSDDQLDFAHNKAYGVTQATSAEPEGITVTNDGKGVFAMVGTWQKGINYDDKTPQDMSGKIYFIPFKNATISTSNNNHQSNNNKPANGTSHSTNGTNKPNSGTNKPASGTNSKPAETNSHNAGTKGKPTTTNNSKPNSGNVQPNTGNASHSATGRKQPTGTRSSSNKPADKQPVPTKQTSASNSKSVTNQSEQNHGSSVASNTGKPKNTQPHEEQDNSKKQANSTSDSVGTTAQDNQSTGKVNTTPVINPAPNHAKSPQPAGSQIDNLSGKQHINPVADGNHVSNAQGTINGMQKSQDASKGSSSVQQGNSDTRMQFQVQQQDAQVESSNVQAGDVSADNGNAPATSGATDNGVISHAGMATSKDQTDGNLSGEAGLPETGMQNDNIVFAAALLALTGSVMVKYENRNRKNS